MKFSPHGKRLSDALILKGERRGDIGKRARQVLQDPKHPNPKVGILFSDWLTDGVDDKQEEERNVGGIEPCLP